VRKSLADAKVFTTNPLARSNRDVAVRNDASSSTMWTVAGGVIGGQ
jgi:hypothetical protein